MCRHRLEIYRKKSNRHRLFYTDTYRSTQPTHTIIGFLWPHNLQSSAQSDRSGFPESLQAVPPEYPSLPYKMPAQIYPSTNAKAAAPPSYKASTAMARGSGGGISSSNPPRISGAISQFPQGLQEEFRCVMTHTHTRPLCVYSCIAEGRRSHKENHTQ